MTQSFTVKDKKGILVYVRLTPNAKKEGFFGIYEDAEAKKWLKASVRAIPEEGKANKALILMFSKKFKVPKTSIHLISGQTDRQKTLLIEDGNELLLKEIMNYGSVD